MSRALINVQLATKACPWNGERCVWGEVGDRGFHLALTSFLLVL